MLERWGFSLLLRLCTGRKRFFLVFFSDVIIWHCLLPSGWAIERSQTIFFADMRPCRVLDICPSSLMGVRIDSLVHAILHSRICLGCLCLRILMICEWEFAVRKLTFQFLRWRIRNGGSKFTKLNDFAL